jgi:uncharacterized membrane protein YsdA (DUF1294 family)
MIPAPERTCPDTEALLPAFLGVNFSLFPYGVDKLMAKASARRIPENTLLLAPCSAE